MLTYALTHKMSLCALIWTTKVRFEAKIDSFLEFLLINFFVWTLKCKETLMLYFFAHENMKLGTQKSWLEISVW